MGRCFLGEGEIREYFCPSTVYAQKEFLDYDVKAREDSAVERATITKLIKTPKTHQNILTTKASLE